MQWVNEGRVDGGVMIEGPFKQQVLAEDGPYYNLKDDVVYNEFAVIKHGHCSIKRTGIC